MRNRFLSYSFLTLIITLICAGQIWSKELKDFPTNRDFKEWYTYFFKENSPISQINGNEVIQLEWQKIADLSSYTFYDYEYKCSSSKDFCISIDYNFEIIKKNGKRIVELLDPDSFVHLIDVKKKTVSQLVSFGSAGTILGAYWTSDKSIVVYGLEFGNGFIFEIDFLARVKKHYKISKDSRVPKSTIHKFILTAQQWSSADR